MIDHVEEGREMAQFDLIYDHVAKAGRVLLATFEIPNPPLVPTAGFWLAALAGLEPTAGELPIGQLVGSGTLLHPAQRRVGQCELQLLHYPLPIWGYQKNTPATGGDDTPTDTPRNLPM